MGRRVICRQFVRINRKTAKRIYDFAIDNGLARISDGNFIVNKVHNGKNSCNTYSFDRNIVRTNGQSTIKEVSRLLQSFVFVRKVTQVQYSIGRRAYVESRTSVPVAYSTFAREAGCSVGHSFNIVSWLSEKGILSVKSYDPECVLYKSKNAEKYILDHANDAVKYYLVRGNEVFKRKRNEYRLMLVSEFYHVHKSRSYNNEKLSSRINCAHNVGVSLNNSGNGNRIFS